MLLNCKIEKEHFFLYKMEISMLPRCKTVLSIYMYIEKIKLLYNYQVHAYFYNVLPSYMYMYYLELIFMFTFSSLKRHEIIVKSF